MSLAQITLTTNKSISSVGDYIRKIGQGEKGQILPVLVTDANGSAYDLTGKNLVFFENKSSGAIIVDDGSDVNSGKFAPVDLKNGRFDYTLQKQVYMEDGTCWFDITNQDGTVVDTTRSFKFVVIPDVKIHVNSDSYVSSLEGLVAHYRSTVDTTVSENKQLINELTNRINQSISKSQNDFSSKLSDWQNDYNAWKAEKETDLTAQLKSITDQINSDKSTTNQIHNELVDIQGQIEAVKKTLSSIDFTKFVTQDQLKTNLDKTNQELENLQGQLKTKADNQTIQNQLETKANTQDVTTNAQRIAALENAGFIKGKFDGFTSADEAKQWSQQNHGIAVFDDGT